MVRHWVLSGARQGDIVDLRQTSSLDVPAPNRFREYLPVLPEEMERAAALALRCGQLVGSPPAGGAWSVLRALPVYVAARVEPVLLDRLHQYRRCIDALMTSEPGSGLTQAVQEPDRTVHWPPEHYLMGRLYAIHSDVEHLNEHNYLETFDRAIKLEFVEKEAIAE